MPAWFHQLLCGHSALYSSLQRAVLDLDDWGLFADITHHHSINIELGTLLRQMERLRLDVNNLWLSKELCEGRLTMAHVYAKVHHLDQLTGPRGASYKGVPWQKKPRNECGRSY
jgi:hypothetical protein